MKKDKIEKKRINRCQSLEQIRNEIDRIDAEIMPLLCERIAYIVQAAQFKESAEDTRRPDRIEAIVTRAKAYASVLGVNVDYMESVYRYLIDESIRQEKAQWLLLNQDKSQQD